MKLTVTNTSKLNGIRGFCLPAVKTCPGKTEACQQYCYGLKNRFTMAEWQHKYLENYLLSKQPCFIELMQNALSFNERLFRVHVTGDFYSQEYFDKWVTIAHNCDWIRFMAYTRNPDIDFSAAPYNLILFYTVDATTKRLPATEMRLAIVVAYQMKRLQHRFTIDLPMTQGILCNSNDCLSCRYCWYKGGYDVLFPQKYAKHNNYKDVLPIVEELKEQHGWKK